MANIGTEHQHDKCPLCRQRRKYADMVYGQMPWNEIKPCPAAMTGILNFDEPTTVHCAGIEGHAGPHYVSLEWGNGVHHEQTRS